MPGGVPLGSRQRGIRSDVGKLFLTDCRSGSTSFDAVMNGAGQQARPAKPEEIAMRVMVLVKSNDETDAGRLPSTEELAAMGKFNEELVQAGVMLAGEGLHSSAKGKRVQFSPEGTTVLDGPFTETKELIAGFWIWQVTSIEEAVQWTKRAPFEDTTIEIRQVFEAEDFGDAMTPDLRTSEEDLRNEVAARQQ
jgi:hypothetical protein